MSARSISHAARVGADIFDRGTAAGLEARASLSASIGYSLNHGHHELVHFQFYSDDFADVRAWGEWLGVVPLERFEEEMCVTFCEAETVVEGVRVRLAGNRKEPTA